jgi:hypothetical protein
MPHQPVRFAFATLLLLFIIFIIITELFGVFYSIKGCAPYGKFKLETNQPPTTRTTTRVQI